MEKFLKPERLGIEPHTKTAEVEFKHWKKTFENFVSDTIDVPVGATAAQLREVDAKQLKLLVNHVTPGIYKYFADSETYIDAFEILDRLYVQSVNYHYARHVLATRKQSNMETVEEYYQALLDLTKNCNFAACTAAKHKDEAVLSAFISGLHSSEIRERILELRSEEVDLKKAVDTAKNKELAAKNTASYNIVQQEMGKTEMLVQEVENPTVAIAASETPNQQAAVAENRSMPSSGNIVRNRGRFNSGTGSRTQSRCNFCGREWHGSRNLCPAKNETCLNCSKIGHYARCCPERRSKSAASAWFFCATIKQQTTEEEDKICSTAQNEAPECLKKATMKVYVNGHKVTALFDTASSDSYIREDLISRFKLQSKPMREEKIGLASEKVSINVSKYCSVNVVVKGEHYREVQLKVMNNLCSQVLLGQDFMKLHDTIVMSFGGTKPPLMVCNATRKLPQPCKLKPVEPFNNLSKDIKPTAIPSRKRSLKEQLIIRRETKALLEAGLIEPSKSPWRAQVLIVDGERMVVDYSRTINRFTYLDAYPSPSTEELVQKLTKYKKFSTVDMARAFHQMRIKPEDRPYTAFEADGKLWQYKVLSFGPTNGVACFQRQMDEFIEDNNLKDTYAYLDNITIGGVTDEEHDRNLQEFLDAAKEVEITLNPDKCVYSSTSIPILGYLVSHGELKPDPERFSTLEKLAPPCNMSELKMTLGLFSYYAKWIPRFSEKIKSLNEIKSFPLSEEARMAFVTLKNELRSATMAGIDEKLPFVVETDASDTAIAAALSQDGKPVAFFSRTLNIHEKRYAAVEKEAHAIVESIQKWRHLLMGRHFTILTDQKSVSFMFNQDVKGKIKNDKIERWRLELSCYSFDILYREGKQNIPADTLSRLCSIWNNPKSKVLLRIHESLCHPGITRMYHYVKSKHLDFTLEEVREMVNACHICCEVKPRFMKPPVAHLIKATQPMERLNIDFKGPLPSQSRNKYILTVVDEFSRFPFAIPCTDVGSETVIRSLCTIFSFTGYPSYVHSDRGSSFLSEDVKNFLLERGIATSKTSIYNPRGNGQCEKYNGTIWKAVTLALKAKSLPITCWEIVLPEALHSIRSLLCTTTGETPHERFFKFNRRSTCGESAPSWLKPGPALLRRFVRRSKYDPLVDEVQILDANPNYAHIRYQNGRETTVSVRDLAPRGLDLKNLVDSEVEIDPPVLENVYDIHDTSDDQGAEGSGEIPSDITRETVPEVDSEPTVRRSARLRNKHCTKNCDCLSRLTKQYGSE